LNPDSFVQPIAWSLPSTLCLLVFGERQNTKCLAVIIFQSSMLAVRREQVKSSDARAKPSYHELMGSE